jgi:hypothetical protein
MFIAFAFQLRFRLCHYQEAGKPDGSEIKWDTSAYVDMSLVGDNLNTLKKNTETCREFDLEMNVENTICCSLVTRRIQAKIVM